MGATRFDYEGREEFFEKLIEDGLSEGTAKSYLSYILNPERGNAYKTALRRWMNLMNLPVPTLDSIKKVHLYLEDNPINEEESSEESSSSIEYALSHGECLELIEELKEERERLFEERKNLKVEIHLLKGSNNNLQGRNDYLIEEAQRRLQQAQKLAAELEKKSKAIVYLKEKHDHATDSSTRQIAMLKSVIADQAVLIHALTQAQSDVQKEGTDV